MTISRVEGDTRELAERHAKEHAESMNVPQRKMGPDLWTRKDATVQEAVSAVLAAVPTPAGLGGAPTRPVNPPRSAEERKRHPVFSGVLQYFPDAILAVAECSWKGNEQHNPGQPLHWAREKSTDQGDCIIRHQMEAGTRDSDGIRHSAKVAWRALAQLQLEIENEMQ